jgi:hypothetical protein
MERRSLLAALACCPVLPLLAQDDVSQPRYKISAGQLHASLSQRFPVRFGVPPLLQVQVSAPRLHLLPSRNLLGAALATQASGLQLQNLPEGEVDVVFALRYEARDQTVRAHEMEVLDVRWPGLPREAFDVLQRVLPTMAREGVGEVVLHKFSRRELALADTMGFEPEKMTVVDDGLLIVFGPKKQRP